MIVRRITAIVIIIVLRRIFGTVANAHPAPAGTVSVKVMPRVMKPVRIVQTSVDIARVLQAVQRQLLHSETMERKLATQPLLEGLVPELATLT